jgi:putative membrane protein
MLLRFLVHWLTLALALFLVSLIPILGISFDGRRSLIEASLVLILLNTFIKPILIFFTLPLVLLSLGLFLLVINAILLYWLPDLVHGFHVPSFTSAFFAALLLSLITGLFSGWERSSRTTTRTASGRGEVIDV